MMQPTKPPRSAATQLRTPLWRQFLLAVLVAGGAVALWAVYVPAALPWLERAGLLAPMTRLGLVSETAEAAPAPRGGGQGPATVVAVSPQMQVLNDTVTAIGSARGARSVVLQSEVAGQVATLSVAPGDYVQAGALVAELDSEAARIAADRATLILADAQATRGRVAALQSRGATTDLQVQEADLALRTAELAVREAAFELSRHRIMAPIAGWVGIMAVEPGGRVAPGSEITRIEDRATLILDFRVPERIVSRLRPGDAVQAAPLADPGMVLTGQITAMDNRVDEASRSLLVQATIPNADDRLRSGMAFQVAITFTGDSYPAVDPLAIQWDAEGSFIWMVREGKAVRLPARIVQRSSSAVLVAADLTEGDLVVTEGVQTLRPGAEVQLTPADGAEAAAAKRPQARG